MQGAAGAAAGSDGEVLFAVFQSPFLIGAGYQMLEPGGVGGVAGDGNVYALMLADGYAFQHIVGAVALYGGSLSVGEGPLLDDFQLAGVEIKVGLYIGEAVDSGDDISGVLAQAVQDNPQGLFSGTVGGAGDADGAFRGGKGLMACQESEALGFVSQQHSAQVAVA